MSGVWTMYTVNCRGRPRESCPMFIRVSLCCALLGQLLLLGDVPNDPIRYQIKEMLRKLKLTCPGMAQGF